MRVLEGLPVYSGGGVFDMGIGAVSSRARFWSGLTFGGIYDGVGLLFNLSFNAGRHLELGTNLRLGASEGEEEYGIGITLGWRLRP